jgi:hypothetical protein
MFARPRSASSSSSSNVKGRGERTKSDQEELLSPTKRVRCKDAMACLLRISTSPYPPRLSLRKDGLGG